MIVVCFSRSMNGSGIEARQFAERAQELRRAVQADRCLKVGPLERLAQHPAEFAIQTDVHFGVGEPCDVREVAAERKDDVHFRADAFDQAANLGEVRRHVERAVARPDDVHARLLAGLARFQGRHFLRAVFGPQPVQRTVRALPLVLVDRARQEALDVGPFRRDAAADHLGDRTRDNDRGLVRIQRAVRAAHRAFRALLSQFVFREAGDHDRQLVRRQCVRVMQHGGDRQVLAPDGPVDDDLQSLDRREDVHGSPVAAGAIVIEHQHQPISSALRALAWRASLRSYCSRNSGRSRGVSSQTPVA